MNSLYDNLLQREDIVELLNRKFNADSFDVWHGNGSCFNMRIGNREYRFDDRVRNENEFFDNLRKYLNEINI